MKIFLCAHDKLSWNATKALSDVIGGGEGSPLVLL